MFPSYHFFTFFAELPSKEYNYWKEFTNMLITLGFVLGLIIFTVWMLKKLMASRSKHLNASTSIKILERRALNQKAALYLVSIAGKEIMISESPAGVQMICDCPQQEKVEVIEEEKPQQTFFIAEKFKKYFVRKND